MAAVQYTWISNTGVWASNSSWKPSGQPGGGGAGVDSAIFDGTSNVSVIGATTGTGIARIITKPAYKGDIGSPGSPLHIELYSATANDGGMATFRGRGNVYFKAAVSNPGNVTVDTDTFDRVVSLDGRWAHVFVKGGKFELLPGVTAIASLNLLTDKARGKVTGDSATVVLLRMDGGELESTEDDWSDIIMRGGHLIQRGLLKDGVDVEMRGGWLEYVPTLSVDTHNPNLYLMGGTLDLSSLTEDLVATNLIIGRNAVILGNLLAQGTPGVTGGIVVDLREDYP